VLAQPADGKAARSAVQVAAVCGGLVLRRTVLPANAFALSWLTVLAFQPTDVADAGCLLSFLCVAVLTWGVTIHAASTFPVVSRPMPCSHRSTWVGYTSGGRFDGKGTGVHRAAILMR
jgi:predicted membrane metal-binding protein